MHINENRIQQFQAGGQFAVYQPLPIDAPRVPAPKIADKEKDKDTEEPALDKSIITKLMGEGIANDVISFSNSMNQAYEEYATLGEVERETSKGKRLRQIMKGDMGVLNLLMRNKKEFDKSIEKVTSGDAYGEIAITSRGLVVKDLQNGKLTEVSHADYAKDMRNTGKQKYKALTNAELINEREYNPSLVNDTSAMNALNSSVGMDTIRKEITSVLSNLGSDSSSESKNAFLDTNDGAAVQQTVQQLVGMSRQGIYKVEQMSSNEPNTRQLKAASSAMWQNLSTNSRSLLKARAVANGANPESIDETAMSYALSLLNPASKTSSVTKTDTSFQEDDLSKTGTKGSKSELTGDAGYYQSLTLQAGNPIGVEIDGGDGDRLSAIGFTSGPMQHGGKPTGKSSLRNIPELKSIANFDSMYFGDNKVDPNFADAVVYNGDDVANVDLPYKSNGKGGVQPDFDVMPKYLALRKQLATLPTAMAKEKAIQASGMPSDGRGNISVPKKAFIVFNGMLNDQALGTSNYNKRFAKNVGANEEKDYERLYRFDGGNLDDDKKDLKPQEYDRWFGAKIWNSLEVLKGQIYIEAKANPAAARYADGKDIVADKATSTTVGLNEFNSFHKPQYNKTGVIPEFTLTP